MLDNINFTKTNHQIRGQFYAGETDYTGMQETANQLFNPGAASTTPDAIANAQGAMTVTTQQDAKSGLKKAEGKFIWFDSYY